MPNTIPYHPSLTLGNIINPSLMKNFKTINTHLKAINKAKEKLDSLLIIYRNIDTTQKQIKGLNVNISIDSLNKYQNNIKESIEKAAGQYIDIKIQKEEEIQNISLSDENNLFFQSPLDYTQTSQKCFPWSTDSLKLDYQYFSFTGNQQDSKTIDNIKSFLENSTKDLQNQTQAQEMSQKVLNKFQDQHEKLNIEGTLIISATCTHKNIMILDPFVLDIHKTLSIWNKIYENDLINIKDIETNTLKEGNATTTENSLDIISGAIYGSCFVGMVHLVKTNQTYSNSSEGNFENRNALINDIREKLKLEKWFAYQLGNVDIDPSQKRHIKNLLSNEEISTHLNIFVTGSAPSIAANDLESGIKSFSNVDFNKFKIKTEDKVSYQENTEELRLESHEISIHNTLSSNILFNLSEIESKKNKVLDIDTMITAFTNYVTNITRCEKDEAFGVPISYYTRSYTKDDIIELCLKANNSNKEKITKT